MFAVVAKVRLLYLITKLQNLKAIHNSTFIGTKRTSLYLITKLQNLKAIHNIVSVGYDKWNVVSNYKITKSESYSQQRNDRRIHEHRCI